MEKAIKPEPTFRVIFADGFVSHLFATFTAASFEARRFGGKVVRHIVGEPDKIVYPVERA